MNKWMHQLARLAREEEGTEVVEWTLVAGLIVVIAAAIMATIGDNVNTVFGAIRDQTQIAADSVPAADTGGTGG